MPASADFLSLALLTLLAAVALAFVLSGVAFLWKGRRRDPVRAREIPHHWSGDDHAARMRSAYFAKERRARAIRERERHVRPATHAHEPGSTEAAPEPPVVVRTRAEVEHRAVLQLEGEVTALSLRQAYLRMIAAYHPDKVAGLGAKLQDLAEEETKRINEAYAFFRQRHGL